MFQSQICTKFVVIFVACLWKTHGQSIGTDLTQCKTASPEVLQRSFDTLFKLECRILFPDYTNISKCSVFNEDDIYKNGSKLNISSDDYEPNTLGEKYGNVTYTIIANMTGGRCFYKYITVMLHLTTKKLCLNLMAEQHITGNISVIQRTYGQYVQLTCKDRNAVLPPGALRGKIKTIWYKNCGFDNLNSNGIRKGRMVPREGNPDDLKVTGMDFYSAGNYTCVVEYEEKLYIVAQYSICIKQRVNLDSYQPTLTCANKHVVAKNHDVHIECKAQVAAGQISRGDIVVKWENKKEGIVCTNNAYNHNTRNERYMCNMSGENSTIRCESFKYGYKETFVQDPANEVLINLYISKVSEKHFQTSYKVSLHHHGKEAKAITILERDWSPLLKYLKAVLLPSIIIPVGVIFFAVGFWWLFKLQLKLIFKRMFGKYVSGDKKYVFCLLYDYDRHDPNADDIIRIRNVICNTASRLKYNYFDQDNDVQSVGGPLIEVVTKAVKESHTMVVIVTENFIENNWARFQSKVCVSSTTPIIFIYTPGTRKKMQCATGWQKITKVEAVSYKVNWRKSMKDNKLGKHIEYALPKVQPRKLQANNGDAYASMDSILLSPSSLNSAVSLDQLLPT